MKSYEINSVDEYIFIAKKEAQPNLKQLRKLIKKTVPKVDERISWGVPFYRYEGLLGGYAAFTNHVNFGLVTSLDSKIAKSLKKKGYAIGKKTIQIRFDQKIPVEEITKLLKMEVKRNLAKKKSKADKSSS